ncbi:hypothetical protein RD792_012518 [Penstemon davidsonii]|uniref:RNA polymerase II C-terminal domain phosphatase-like n=1 Tax=Penstemon davidsonii TaxID=160366 RepID=A0ABR0CX31_9LAMI|nr:hypothetical protein RD792_012518 [Penstemon davidsonii]
MSLAADSPVHSSSSDDFAAILDAELDKISDASADTREVSEEEQDSDHGEESDSNLDLKRVKRRKVEICEGIIDPLSSTSQGEPTQTSGALSLEKEACLHPGAYGGLCVKCGQEMDEESGVAFGIKQQYNTRSRNPLSMISCTCVTKKDYMFMEVYLSCLQNLRLANDEIARLRDKDLKNLLHHKKLYLVLDLDHTLLNSARLPDITAEEGYLNGQRDSLPGTFSLAVICTLSNLGCKILNNLKIYNLRSPDTLKSSLFRLDRMQMMTKLRPFVHNFLKEASNLFEMYIYTMGERPYALEMAKLLDPGDIYFNSKVIAQGDCTERHQKGLDVVLGQESAVLILDDTEGVWGKHKENLILMERYHFFASNCQHFGFNTKSLSQLKSDESETEGALATVLKVLQRVHSLFYDPVSFLQERKDDLVDRDARQASFK